MMQQEDEGIRAGARRGAEPKPETTESSGEVAPIRAGDATG